MNDTKGRKSEKTRFGGERNKYENETKEHLPSKGTLHALRLQQFGTAKVILRLLQPHRLPAYAQMGPYAYIPPSHH